MMVDFSDIEKSTIISPPGQSGHFKSPYYDSMSKIWANGDQIPMKYTSARGLAQTLTLVPGSGG
jgi:penicillin amidase